jgi:elongation factor 2
MTPINTLAKAVISGENDVVAKMLTTLKIELDSEERELQGKQLLKVVMRRWMDAADAILEMMVLHLPSPK